MAQRKSTIRTVDKLTITFLVDNSIEWMTKLPPGFTHEVVLHLHQDASSPDEVKGVPVLNFDKFCCGAHGFSALLETQVNDERQHLTLFDTGPDSLSLVRNVAALQVPVDKIDRIITSHWHSDHTGGLLSFLRLRATESGSSPCIVDVHPDRPISRGIAPGPTFDKVICAIPPDPSFAQIEEAGGIVEKHAEGHAVAGGTVWISGEIPRVTTFEIGMLSGVRWIEESLEGGDARGKWIPEHQIMDERYAAVDVAGKGLVLFSACSHAGIVNVVKDAISTFERPVYMIIGGLHLAGSEFDSRLAPTVDFLSRQLKPAPTYVLPMHCSGFRTKVALEAALGEGCVPAGVGHRVHIVGNRDDEVKLFSPTY